MKAVQIIARSQPVFIEIPKPQLRPGYALIKTLRLALCGSDIRQIHYMPAAHYPSPPGETGHEMVGIIAAISPAAHDLRVGQPVLALAPDHQAMCEYYLAPIDRLLPLDENIPLEHSVQAQQLGTVLYAAKALPDLSGKSVAVIGQGSAGLWFNAVLRERGAKQIIALDRKAYRLRLSRHYGATHCIHNADGAAAAALRDCLRDCNDGQLPDVVIEAAGETDAITLAIDIVRENGFVLFFGVPRFETMEFPILQYFVKTITAKSMVHASREPQHASTRQALAWINSGRVDAAPMLTHTFAFADVLDAYALHHLQGEGAVKIVINMEQ